MNIQFDSKELEKAVQAVNRATTGRLPNPMFAGIMIETVDATKVQFTATNYEIFIRYTVSARVLEFGKALVSGKLFHELIRRMPGAEIYVKNGKKANMLTVQSGRAVYDILTIEASGYPEVEKIEAENSVVISVSDLQNIHRKTAFAVKEFSSDKPIFAGIRFAFKDGMLQAAATDTHRLSKISIPMESSLEEIIIPPKVLQEVTALADGDNVNLGWQAGKIAFWTDQLYLTSRTISGQWPDIERVIPKKLPIKVTINRLELLGAIERLSVVSIERHDKVTLNDIYISIEKDIIVLKGNTADKGAATEEVPVLVEGEATEIFLNGTQIIECLKALDSNEVIFSMAGPRSQATIIDENDESFIYVISPIVRQQSVAS